jgi:hypothetical protein
MPICASSTSCQKLFLDGNVAFFAVAAAKPQLPANRPGSSRRRQSKMAHDPATKTKHEAQRNVTFWMQADELARLDNHLADQCAGKPGVRPSRQGFLLDLVRRELAQTGDGR